jgi:hypothetical protein
MYEADRCLEIFHTVLREKLYDPVPRRANQQNELTLPDYCRLLLSTAAGAGNGGKYVRDISGVE